MILGKSSPFIVWLSQPLHRLVMLIAILPIFVVSLYVAKYAISVPLNDQWGVSVELAIKTQTGDIGLQDLIKQHAEHRIFFTNLVTVIVAKVTPWDLKYEAYLSFVLGFANLCLLAKLLYDDEPRALAIGLIPFSMLVFSLRQSLNWTSGFLNCWHFCTFFLLLSLLALRKGAIGWRSLGLGAFFAFCTMYSLGAGLAVWFLLVPTLWMLGYRKWYYFVFWALVALLSYYTYFLGYDFDRKERLYDVVAIAQFASVYVGNPFLPPSAPDLEPLASVYCVLGLVLFVVNFVYLKSVGYSWARLSIWLTLAFYVLGTSLVTALSRSSSGSLLALAGRYVSLSLLFWVSVVALGAMSIVHILNDLQTPTRWKFLVHLNSLCLVILAGSYIYANYKAIDTPALITFEERACLVAYPTTQDSACLYNLHPSFVNYDRPKRQERLYAFIDELVKYKLAVFADDAPGDLMLPYQYNTAGQTALQTNNTTEALELSKRGIELYPDDASLYLQRGKVYIQLGNMDEALADFSEAIRLDPLNIEALTERGGLYLAQGKDKEAQRDFLQVLDIDPANSFAKTQLARIKPAQDKKNK